MPGHRVAHDLGGAAEGGGMNDGIARAEYPLIAVEPSMRIPVSSHATNRARRNAASASSRLAAKRRCALEHVHQRALADLKAEQIAKHAL